MYIISFSYKLCSIENVENKVHNCVSKKVIKKKINVKNKNIHIPRYFNHWQELNDKSWHLCKMIPSKNQHQIRVYQIFFLLFSSGFILSINSALVEYASMRSKTVQLTDRNTDILEWPTRIIHNGKSKWYCKTPL